MLIDVIVFESGAVSCFRGADMSAKRNIAMYASLAVIDENKLVGSEKLIPNSDSFRPAISAAA